LAALRVHICNIKQKSVNAIFNQGTVARQS